MSEEIKKEAQDTELNPENLVMVAGGESAFDESAFDGWVPPFLVRCKRTTPIRQNPGMQNLVIKSYPAGTVFTITDIRIAGGMQWGHLKPGAGIPTFYASDGGYLPLSYTEPVVSLG